MTLRPSDEPIARPVVRALALIQRVGGGGGEESLAEVQVIRLKKSPQPGQTAYFQYE